LFLIWQYGDEVSSDDIWWTNMNFQEKNVFKYRQRKLHIFVIREEGGFYLYFAIFR
jgi:hypothetical protein